MDLYKIRVGLYIALFVWAFLLMATTAARLNYTRHLSPHDPLNHGHSFTDPSIAELLFTSIVALLFVPSLIAIIHKRIEHAVVSRTFFEIAALIVLWLFWIGGTAAATNVWPATLLASCASFKQCQLLQAILAFAWLGWITLTVLLVGTLIVAVREQSWSDHTHGEWSDKKFNVPIKRRQNQTV